MRNAAQQLVCGADILKASLDTLKNLHMDAFAWPGAVVVLVIFFLVFFRSGVNDLLRRTTSVSKEGLQANPGPLEPQRERPAREPLLAYQSPLIAEMEVRIRDDMHNRGIPDAERERALINHLAVAQVLREFDLIATGIYSSQHTFLQMLNVSAQPVASALGEPIYAAAASNHPALYEDTSFDNWLGWMLQANLMRREGDGWRITVKGREFLQYLVGTGRAIFNTL